MPGVGDRRGSGGPYEERYGYSRVVRVGPLAMTAGCTSVVNNVVEGIGDPGLQARIAFGIALAALAGVVAGGFVGVYPGADFEILPYAFVVVIVGGMGSLKGALIGSLMVGLLDNFGKALFPELSYFTLFAPMAAILAVRPTGLYGRA